MRHYNEKKSKKEAFEMAKDALEAIVAENNFKVTIQPLKEGNFTISANDMKPLISKTIKHKKRRASSKSYQA